MLSGHLPFMAKLVSQLVTGADDRPGSIVCLEAGDDGAWQINWMPRPELIP